MKKLLALLLSLIFITSLVLTGCAKDNKKDDSKDTAKDNSVSKTDDTKTVDDKQELTEVTWAVILMQSAAPDLPLIEEELNKITEKEIGVHVNILGINAGDYMTQMNLMMSGSEDLDIVLTFTGIFQSWVAMGGLIPIDDYLQANGQGIIDTLGEQYLEAGKINGKQYGITTNREFASAGGFGFRKDILDKYGITLKERSTYEEVEEILAKVHENEPDLICLTSNVVGAQWFQIVGSGSVDNLGDNFGVLMDMTDEELKVENLYTSDVYKDFIYRMRDWYNKGYIQSDISTSTEVGATLMKSGRAFGETVSSKPGLETQLRNETGYEMVVTTLSDPYSCTRHVALMQYAIAKNSKNPAKAIELLNLLFTNPEASRLVVWGIKDRHYVEAEDGHLTYPEGVDATNSGYHLVQGYAFPNQFIAGVWEGDPIDIWESMADFNNSAKVSKAMGFTFDSSKVKTEYAACTAVLEQYAVGIESGHIDPDAKYEEFVKALEDAGIDKIIEEKQNQLNDWAANRK